MLGRAIIVAVFFIIAETIGFEPIARVMGVMCLLWYIFRGGSDEIKEPKKELFPLGKGPQPINQKAESSTEDILN